MKRKNKFNGIIYVAISLITAIVVIGAGAYAYSVNQNQTIETQNNYYEVTGEPSPPGDISYGAQPGPDNYDRNFFFEGLTQGGLLATSSTARAWTLAITETRKLPTTILWEANQPLALSLGATTTGAYVPRIGDTADLYIRNASSTSHSTITFDAVDGALDLQVASSTITAGNLTIYGLEYAHLKIIRTNPTGTGTSSISVLLNKFILAD